MQPRLHEMCVAHEIRFAYDRRILFHCTIAQFYIVRYFTSLCGISLFVEQICSLNKKVMISWT